MHYFHPIFGLILKEQPKIHDKIRSDKPSVCLDFGQFVWHPLVYTAQAKRVTSKTYGPKLLRMYCRGAGFDGNTDYTECRFSFLLYAVVYSKECIINKS